MKVEVLTSSGLTDLYVGEMFKFVPGTDKRVIVSNRGTVLKRRYKRDYYEFVKPCPNNCGYLQVNVPKLGTTLVHRLVAKTFLPREDGDVDHINQNKEDNRVENLRFVSHQENCRNKKFSKLKRSWKNIEIVGLGTYPDLTTALEAVFPLGIPKGSRSRITNCINSGNKAYGYLWKSY